jgi:predicted dehydrogenase
MPERLRVALVGAGHMGKFHAQAIADNPDVELVAVCDVDADRAAAVAAPTGARAITGIAALAGEVDAAVIAAATSVHHKLAVPLMEAGIAVLIEKPLAGTAEEARQIALVARRTGVVAQTGHILRFDPVTRTLAGRALKPKFIEFTWAAPFTFRSMDVGVVMDVGIHGLDLVLHLVGEMPSRVDSVGGVVVGPHEDFVNVRLTFPGGCVAVLSASRISRSRQRLVRVFAEGAYVKLDYQNRAAEWLTPKPGLAELARIGKPTPGGMDDLLAIEKFPIADKPDGLRAQFASFIEAVRGKHPVACTLDDGARAVEVAEQVIRGVRGLGR